MLARRSAILASVAVMLLGTACTHANSARSSALDKRLWHVAVEAALGMTPIARADAVRIRESRARTLTGDGDLVPGRPLVWFVQVEAPKEFVCYACPSLAGPVRGRFITVIVDATTFMGLGGKGIGERPVDLSKLGNVVELRQP